MEDFFGLSKMLIDNKLAIVIDPFNDEQIYINTGLELDDVTFYYDEAKTCKGKVLELGCGYGRILLQLIEKGIQIEGLERAEKLINFAMQAAEKRNVKVKIYNADMRNISNIVEEIYELVICPNYVMDYIESYEEFEKLLLSIKDRLQLGGTLIFNVDLKDEAEVDYGPAISNIKYNEAEKKLYTSIVQTKNLNDDCRVCNLTTFVTEKQKTKLYVSCVREFRWNIEKILKIVEKTGFEVEEMYKDYERYGMTKDMSFENQYRFYVDVEKSLELFGDMEMYDDTLNEFLNGVNEKLEKIKAYKEASDMANYAILVHSLKSDARYLGFTKLAELAYNHELKSKENDVNYVYENYDSLMEEANRIVKVASNYAGVECNIVVEEVKQNVQKDKTILVVDDSTLIRSFIQKVFDDEYEVKMANDGLEAINIINSDSEHKIVAMLLDLNMPNVNGFQVLEYFKQNGLFTKVPVSIITGDDAKDTVNRAFAYPIVDVLTKPFNERDVKRVLEKTIEFM